MNVFAVVEYAFSQDHDKLMKKIQYEVEGWPEISLVVAVFVSEGKYKPPPENSPTWDYFTKHESILPYSHFLSLPSSADGFSTSPLVECALSNTDDLDSQSAFSCSSDSDSYKLDLGPITTAGHTWCEIHNVQYRVRVKESGVLDLAKGSINGFLFPMIETEMEGMELAINGGLTSVKSKIAGFVAKTTLRNLQEAELRVKFDWPAIQFCIKIAAGQIAVSRYQAWFYESFRGTKHPHLEDRSFSPSSSESNSSVACLEPTNLT